MRTLYCGFFLILFGVAALTAADSRAIADAAFDELLNQDFVALVKRFSPEVGQSLTSLKAGAVVSEVFRTTPDGDLRLWIHLPDDWSRDYKRAAIVFFFGGGWTTGEVKQFEPQAAYLASRGMVAVRADYRVFSRQKVNPDSCVLDAMAAMRWVRAHASALGIDPDRIASSGGSSGGQLAACMGIGVGLKGDGDYLEVPYKSNAMVLFNPALDMPAIQEMLKANSARTQMKWHLDDETARKISPKHNVSENAPPTIIFFGTEDSLLGQLEPFLKEIKDKGTKTEVYLAPGQQHGFFNRSPWLERTIKRMDEFLVELGYLKGPPTIEVPEGKDDSSTPQRK